MRSAFVLPLGEKEVNLREHGVHKVLPGPDFLPSPLSLSPSSSFLSPSIQEAPHTCWSFGSQVASKFQTVKPHQLPFITNYLLNAEAKEEELHRREEGNK